MEVILRGKIHCDDIRHPIKKKKKKKERKNYYEKFKKYFVDIGVFDYYGRS